MTFQNINHIFRFSRFSRLVWTMKWAAQISKGLVGFKVSDKKVVCSNNFECGKPTFCATFQQCTWQSVAVVRARHVEEENWIINVSRLCQRIFKMQLKFLLIMTKKFCVIYWFNLPCHLMILPEILMWSCILVFQIHQHLDLFLIS